MVSDASAKWLSGPPQQTHWHLLLLLGGRNPKSQSFIFFPLSSYSNTCSCWIVLIKFTLSSTEHFYLTLNTIKAEDSQSGRTITQTRCTGNETEHNHWFDTIIIIIINLFYIYYGQLLWAVWVLSDGYGAFAGPSSRPQHYSVRRRSSLFSSLTHMHIHTHTHSSLSMSHYSNQCLNLFWMWLCIYI